MPELPVLNLHAVLPVSGVNGPGKRMVVFFQGCLRGCPGCFNPGTHPFKDAISTGVDGLFAKWFVPGIYGLTVSGGEPFMQPVGLLSLLGAAHGRGLSTVVYTGYTIEEIRDDPAMARCLTHTDVLVDGPYDAASPEKTLLARGSTNQRLHFLSGRYTIDDFLLPGKAEVIIGRDGTVKSTGFSRIPFPAALL